MAPDDETRRCMERLLVRPMTNGDERTTASHNHYWLWSSLQNCYVCSTCGGRWKP